jgi:uncharacterized protein (TIGR02145 family)
MRRHLISLIIGASFFAVPASAQTDCGWNPDYDGDNQVGVADLLGLLGVFEEQDSDDDGIWDSQDDCIGVVDPCGICNGTGLDEDLDGLCDDIDDCVGVYDECGVCNGPGPDVPVIENIEVFYDSAYIEAIDFWFVYEVGADTTFSFVCAPAGCTDPEAANFNPDAVIDDGSCAYGPPECGGATTVTFDGYTYDLVAIGSQCWFAENLRTTTYANGDPIPGNLTDSEWTSTTSGATTVYGEGTSTVYDGSDDEVANLENYGRLYNWYAVDDSRGLCPSGWHVPTDGEWMTLEMELGMTSSEANGTGGRGTDQGAQMKSSASDTPSWNGTNTSGFSALPGGLRNYYSGNFSDVGNYGYWWSASPVGASGAWSRGLYSDNDYVYRNSNYQRIGFSVRCVRDE